MLGVDLSPVTLAVQRPVSPAIAGVMGLADLADQAFDADTGIQTYDVAFAFRNATGYALTVAPAGVTISGSVVSFDTAVAVSGAVSVRASDAAGGFVDRPFGLTVVEVTAGAPAGTGNLADVSVLQGSGEITVDISGGWTGDNLVYSIVSAPPGVAFGYFNLPDVLRIDTSATVAGGTVVLRATNSLGSADQAFNLDVLARTISFSSFTGTTVGAFSTNSSGTVYYQFSTASVRTKEQIIAGGEFLSGSAQTDAGGFTIDFDLTGAPEPLYLHIFVRATNGADTNLLAITAVEGVVVYPAMTSGTVTDYTDADGAWRVHSFTTSDVLEVTTGGEVQILAVAGGGPGGGKRFVRGGGGGAGGILRSPGLDHFLTSLSPGTHSVTVGAGGISVLVDGTTVIEPGTAGGDTFLTAPGGAEILRALGGGWGGTTEKRAVIAGNGVYGSAGGNHGAWPDIDPPQGTPGQGNNGGLANGGTGSDSGGGGGGAGGPGQNTAPGTSTVTAGGPGIVSAITGAALTYGLGGSANPANSPASVSGAPNTGNGGEGNGQTVLGARGGNGGSGVFHIRYRR